MQTPQFIRLIKRFVSGYKRYVGLNFMFNILSTLFSLFSFALIIPILNILFKIENQVYTYMIGDDYARDRVITVIKEDDPTITGLDTVTLQVGDSFDPLDGVSATDSKGEPLEVESELQLFTGLTSETINQGESFNLTDGVKALDANGSVIPYTVSPSTIDNCAVGTQVFTYTSARGSATRSITVTQIADPTISGADESLSEFVGVAFDPLDGVSAVDGNGNTITVTVELEGE